MRGGEIGWRGLRRAAGDAVAVVAALDCPGCGRASNGACGECLTALRERARVEWTALDVAPRPASLGRAASRPAAGPPAAAAPTPLVASAAPYEGAVRELVGALKERSRLDAAAALAPLLRLSLAAALAAVRDEPPERAPGGAPARLPLSLALAPSSRASTRARGFSPLEALVRRALPRADHDLAVRALRHIRPVADQAGLDIAGRARNQRGAILAHPRMRGRRVVLVDDVVTTGATLREAVRALAEAGAQTVAIAVVARTERRFPQTP